MHQRFRIALLLTVLAPLAAGCNLFRPTRALEPTAELSDVVGLVNNRSSQLNSLYTTNASISGEANGQSFPTLQAQIAVERPGNLRLVGKTMLTGKEVDNISSAMRGLFSM